MVGTNSPFHVLLGVIPVFSYFSGLWSKCQVDKIKPFMRDLSALAFKLPTDTLNYPLVIFFVRCWDFCLASKVSQDL